MTGEELNILSKIKVRPVEEQRDILLEQNMLLTGKNATLEKENAELKDYRLTTLAKQQTEMSKYALNLEKKLSWYDTQLTKAKDHIKQLLDCLKQDTSDPETNYYVCQYMDKAEQFLREVGQDLNEGCPDTLCEDCTKEDCTVRKLGLVSTKEIKK